MTSTDFLEKAYKILDDQNYRITFSPAQKKNYMMYCNGNFIGGLFDEKFCLVYSDAGNTLLHNPEPVYRGYSDTAQHKMFVVPLETAKEALCATYGERFGGKTFVYDMTCTNRGAAVIEHFYDENVVFLKFCHDNELLQANPLDKNNRIIRMVFYNNDLTAKGIAIFPHLLTKFLSFYNRAGEKTDLQKMLRKWLAGFEKNTAHESQTCNNGNTKNK